MRFEIVPGISVLIDFDDLDRVRAKIWTLVKKTNRGHYFVHRYRAAGRYQTISLQRLISDSDVGQCVTFVDVDRQDDYRKENLRVCSRREVVLAHRAF